MTEQEQFKAMAELDGWKFHPSRDVNGVARNEYWEYCIEEVAYCYKDFPADYSTRDAIIAVIEKQPQKIQLAVIKLLDTDCIDGWYDWQVLKVLLATPAQLREALLRATNKWKD